jgi:hypothetical protein
VGSGDIQVERIGSLAQLADFGQEWDNLQRRCAEKYVLLDHRWVCTWLELFGKDKQLHVLVLRAGGAVVGIVPLIISSGFELFPSRNHQIYTADDYKYTWVPRYVRLVPIRRLSFPLSVPVGNRRSHFMFVEHDPRFYALTANYMASIARKWDLMVIEGFPRGSPQEDLLLRAVAASGLQDDDRKFDRLTLWADLPESMDTFLAAKSNHFRKRLRAACRQAQDSFPDLRVREFRGLEIDEGIERIFLLERRSWKASGTKRRHFRVRPEARLETFHRAVARAFAATDGAVVLTMDVGERPVAGIYCLERDGVVMPITTFMDEEFADRLTTAPMFRRLVEMSIDRGLKELDFNGYTDNIAKWADKTRASSRFYFYNRQPYSQFLRALSRTAHLAHGALVSLRRSPQSVAGESR